jgi:hypothetical protein
VDAGGWPGSQTAGFRQHEQVVLDVPSDGFAIAFGVLLSGPGTVWVDDFKFERVPTTTPVTSPSVGQGQPRSPVNLDFNQ